MILIFLVRVRFCSLNCLICECSPSYPAHQRQNWMPFWQNWERYHWNVGNIELVGNNNEDPTCFVGCFRSRRQKRQRSVDGFTGGLCGGFVSRAARFVSHLQSGRQHFRSEFTVSLITGSQGKFQCAYAMLFFCGFAFFCSFFDELTFFFEEICFFFLSFFLRKFCFLGDLP